MAEPTQTDVFLSGREGYHTFRIPALVVTTEGTILAICEGRKTSGSDHGDIDLVLKRSTDGGRTWGKLQVIHDEGGDAKVTIGNPCPVVDRSTGIVWLPFTRNNDRVFVTHSTDDGQTWAKPREITKDVKREHWTWYATGPGHGIQLASGRLLIPCDHRDPTLPEPRDRRSTTRSHVIYSDDGGKTWKVGGILPRRTNECEAVETVDGSLYLNTRNNFGRKRRAYARSRDGGQSWSEIAFDEALVTPTCQASVVRYTDARRHDRNRCLFSNPAAASRTRMTVRISTDECRTWSQGKVLHAGPAAYSDLAVAPDLAICCLYERGDKHPYERITFAKFDLAWLTDGADRLAAKHLALDSRVIGRAERVRLVLGKVEKDKRNPLFREDKPWEPRFDNLYANVIRDDDGLYKCWYSPFIIDRPSAETPAEEKKRVSYMQAARKMRAEKGKGPWREMGICYAVSKDGIAWEKPDLGLVELKGSKHNNLVLRGPHGTGIWKDPRDPDPQRRYKMIFKGRRMSVAFSPDGLRWSKPVPCAAMAARGDTHNNAFWAPDLGRYVAITRLWDGQRIVGRSQSEDFVRWTRAVEVLRGDTTRQTYAMPVFRYAGVYLGLLMVLDKRTDLVDCELAWSPDTVRWERVCPGTPLIPRGPKGSHDWGCVYAAACPVVLEDEIRLYYGGSDGQHTNWRDGSFCLARLRPDGFACMEPTAPDAVGVVVTKPILCVGQALTVTADAAGGSLRVAVEGAEGLGLDTCRPITQNVTDSRIRWKGDGDLAAFVGRRIRLRFELRAARLYAFGFEGT